MRPKLVVLDPPQLDLRSSILHRQEPIDVQTLISQRTVERLNESGGMSTWSLHGFRSSSSANRRCASLVGLQRYVDTDRVPNDGVSGPCYLPDDLTAALANLSKTLREVVDGQTK